MPLSSGAKVGFAFGDFIRLAGMPAWTGNAKISGLPANPANIITRLSQSGGMTHRSNQILLSNPALSASCLAVDNPGLSQHYF